VEVDLETPLRSGDPATEMEFVVVASAHEVEAPEEEVPEQDAASSWSSLLPLASTA
jgi:hypothetical protein